MFCYMVVNILSFVVENGIYLCSFYSGNLLNLALFFLKKFLYMFQSQSTFYFNLFREWLKSTTKFIYLLSQCFVFRFHVFDWDFYPLLDLFHRFVKFLCVKQG